MEFYDSYFCDLSSFICIGCEEEIEGKKVGPSDYHSHCFPCIECGEAAENGRYVIPSTGYHTHCLPCSKCGKSIEDDRYVNPYTGKHFNCH